MSEADLWKVMFWVVVVGFIVYWAYRAFGDPDELAERRKQRQKKRKAKERAKARKARGQ